MTTILYEGRDLFRSGGTGIATYARMLGSVARGLGHRTQVVVGTDVGLDPKDPVLSEIRFYDAPRTRISRAQRLGMSWRRLIGAPRGLTPLELPRVGAVIDPSPGSSAAFQTTFAAYKLFDVAEYHFRRYKQRATLRFKSPPNIFHAAHPTPLRVPGAANIYTIHDLVPLRLPYATLDDKKYFYQLIMHLCQNSDHIVTVSEFSRRDIIQLTGIREDRITNTYQSIKFPNELLQRTEDEVAQELDHIFNLDMNDYFLFFGAIEPKKNVSRIIDAFAASGSKRSLVLAGGFGWQFKDDAKRIKDERFLTYRLSDGIISAHRRVRQLPYVPFDHLVTLIRGARGVLFPSLYEGFGLPVLESMMLGTPVITSNVASLPEIAGDSALLVDPSDVGSITQAIRQLDNDADLRLDLAARGRERAQFFSVDKYGERVGTLYRRFAS